MIALILSNLATGALIAVVAGCWANAKTWAAGAKVGAIVMFLFALSIDLMFESFMRFYVGAAIIIVDIVVNTVMGGIAGAVIGFILGKMDKQEA